MKNLVDKVIEMIELSRDMTQEQYEYWKTETLQQCLDHDLVCAFLEEVFKIIEEYR